VNGGNGHDLLASGAALDNLLGDFFDSLIGRSFTDHPAFEHLLDSPGKLLLVAGGQIGRKLLIGHAQLPPGDRSAGNVHPETKLIL